MDYRVYKPSAGLSDFVMCYWAVNSSIYGQEGRTRVYPDGTMQIIFHYGDKMIKHHPDGSITKQPGSMVCGQNLTFADIEPTGTTGMIAVQFTPFGAAAFFNIPLFELTDECYSLDDICGKQGRSLEEKIGNARHDYERVIFIEQFLMKSFCIRNRYDFEIIRESVNTIKKAGYPITVDKLSSEMSVSGRQLERKFRAYIGISPKFYLRVDRLNKAVDAIKLMEGKNLTELSYQCGFYDQAHCINDFKLLTGLTPLSFSKALHSK